jgi:hypothetical protein
VVSGRDPECERLLKQTQQSLLAMQRHIINYKLRVIWLSLRNPVETSDSHGREKVPDSANIPSFKSRN